ncbi:GSU2403 family nucleotidyltransferase fold protein [Bradyrhizobium murdochi]|uniref:GSU2403 family nucleotidyltransferase fold protein n=1 Tax=Bradyrhizobium murdochi TaxID=1038859 RepID=UPI00040B215D|nr:GSU2403 family nucleotidyltransferase fold protein [Bradyrhizobium murdochi]
MPAPTLVGQTTYAELLERSANAAFQDAFAEDGAFTAKTIKGRKYWYFQAGTGAERSQRYVGPETPELLERIARHKDIREDERERRALVSTLVRSFGFPRPIPEIGEIIAALAKAGVFRLRGVLVGTVAYQTYAAMLGVRLSVGSLQTGDVDIAQFKNVSVAVEDSTPPVLEVLKEVDKTFRPVPHTADGRRVTSYAARGGLRVDFLTPHEGKETAKPQKLPALHTDAQPLRFLDFLIRDPEPAVILHGAGIHVHVPAPARYAVHKLIVSRRRPEGFAKRDKDLQQAEALLAALADKRPYEVKLAWEEAYGRGPKWRQLLIEGLGLLAAPVRDTVLKTIGLRRSAIPGIDLSFENPPARYDFGRDVVTFTGQALDQPVSCAISREALDDHFGADGLGQEGRLQAFLKNRSRIEEIARAKYVASPVEEPGAVLIKTSDVERFPQTGSLGSKTSSAPRTPKRK